MEKKMEKNWDRSDGFGASVTRPLPSFPLRPLSSGSYTEPGSTLSPSSQPWLGRMVRLIRAVATSAQSQALTLNSVGEDLGLCLRDLIPGLGRWGRPRKIRVKFGRVWCGGCVWCDEPRVSWKVCYVAAPWRLLLQRIYTVDGKRSWSYLVRRGVHLKPNNLILTWFMGFFSVVYE